MVFQGLDQQQAEAVWRPFFDWVAGQSEDFSLEGEPMIIAAPARNFWDPEFLKQLPGLVLADDRPGAPEGNVFWASNLGEAGQVLHGYRSAWIPASFLQATSARPRPPPCSARRSTGAWRCTSTRALPALPTGRSRLRGTRPPTRPCWRLSRLLISGAEGPPAYPGFPGHEPDLATARREAAAVDRAMDEVRRAAALGRLLRVGERLLRGGLAGGLLGAELRQLRAVKDKYDPDGLFFVHHGVGSEGWSADGFTKPAETKLSRTTSEWSVKLACRTARRASICGSSRSKSRSGDSGKEAKFAVELAAPRSS